MAAFLILSGEAAGGNPLLRISLAVRLCSWSGDASRVPHVSIEATMTGIRLQLVITLRIKSEAN